MKSTTGVISLMFLVAFFHSCYSRKCYQCDTSEDDGCDANINSTFLKDCEADEQCYSVNFNLIEYGFNFTVRSCEAKGVSTIQWDTCSSDGCNGNTMEHKTNRNGGNIKCYVCESDSHNSNTKCENIVDKHHLTTCKTTNEECSTMETFNSNNTRIAVVRNCVSKGMKLVSQRHCDVDGCNGNSEIASSQP